MQTSITTLLLATLLGLFTFAQAQSHAIPCDRCDPVPKAVADALTCDITTSCITVKPNGQYHCACRAGYKSSWGDNAAYHQYRMPFANQDYRVFVRPGVVCDTLCNDWQLGAFSCQEVNIRPECA